jgi:multidrug efflux system membrane fusion protein
MPVRRVALVLAFCTIVGVGYWRADLLNFLSRAGIVFASPGAATPGKVSESSSQQNNPAKAAPPVFVKTAIASVGSLHIQRQAIGWLVSPASVNLTSPQQGTIVELVAKEGANLRRGDLIAKLDDRSSQSAVAKDRAQLTRDQALLTQAELNLSRAQILFSKGMGAQQARDDAKAAQQTAAATIDIDNAALATDLVNVSNAEIRAPFDGRIGAFQVAVGNLVLPGGAIVAITQMSPLQVKFSLPETDLPSLRQAQQNGGASVQVGPTAFAADLVAGSVDFVDSVIDQSSGTFKARATIPNADLALWPGQSVTVVVALDLKPGLALVPTQAIQPTSSGSVVYVIGPDQTVDVRAVTVAGADADKTGIAAGLKPGEHVVVEGQMALGQGTRVEEASNTPTGPDKEASIESGVLR